MSTISVLSGSYCHGKEIVQRVAQALGCQVLDDLEIVKRASERSGVPQKKFHRTLLGKVSAFNAFTHERQRNTSYLKAIVAEFLTEPDCILWGSSGRLIPGAVRRHPCRPEALDRLAP